MVPAGGYKGVGAATLVEIMAACLAGATLGVDASPFSGTAGGPPRTGQLFIAIAPEATSGGAFAARIAGLVAALTAEPGTHLPGSRRLAARARALAQGVAVDRATYDTVLALQG
jgi:(2R)-3-sulfolactate dehydrogenase (NADP+)